MKQIKELFARLQEENQNLGDYVVLGMAIKGNNYHDATITRLFNKLIPKDDYLKSEKAGLLKNLFKLSKTKTL